MLHLHNCHCQTMTGQAVAAYPQECCGIILGLILENGDRQAREIRPVVNAWSPELEIEHSSNSEPSAASEAVPTRSGQATHSCQDSFAIDSRDLFQAQKDARSLGWQIIGIYHSHPDHPAEPSERDRQSAWPGYSYVILSVHGFAQAALITDLKSWCLNDQHQFTPEAYQIEF